MILLKKKIIVLVIIFVVLLACIGGYFINDNIQINNQVSIVQNYINNKDYVSAIKKCDTLLNKRNISKINVLRKKSKSLLIDEIKLLDKNKQYQNEIEKCNLVLSKFEDSDIRKILNQTRNFINAKYKIEAYIFIKCS